MHSLPGGCVRRNVAVLEQQLRTLALVRRGEGSGRTGIDGSCGSRGVPRAGAGLWRWEAAPPSGMARSRRHEWRPRSSARSLAWVGLHRLAGPFLLADLHALAADARMRTSLS